MTTTTLTVSKIADRSTSFHTDTSLELTTTASCRVFLDRQCVIADMPLPAGDRLRFLAPAGSSIVVKRDGIANGTVTVRQIDMRATDYADLRPADMQISTY